MKKNYVFPLFFMFLVFFTTNSSVAQDEPIRVRNANREGQPVRVQEKGFQKQDLFTGGTATVSFYSGGTILGANPMFGIKLNDYFDAGAVLNFAYTGQKDYIQVNDKIRQFVYGPGVFLRAYPVPFLFAQAQVEENFTSQRYVPVSGAASSKTVNAPSLLVGAGYATGRIKGGTSFFYMSLLFDVLKNKNSPYVNLRHYGTADERVDIVPIIRAGFNIGLFQGRYGKYQEF